MWRAGTSGRADVARGTTALTRRGTEATWQSAGGRREAQVCVEGADTWQEATRSTRVHADAREGTTWHVGWHMEGPQV